MTPLLPNIVALIAMAALTAYVLMGGADFGGGVWDLLASGARKAEQRRVITDALTPIWEANHVWLILVIVVLFTCFPAAFARLAIVLHIPLLLVLVGIVLRGSAFTFRAYDTRHDMAQRRWGRIFSVASLVTPLLLGACIGALAADRVVPPSGASFVHDYVRPWLSPFTFAVGAMALAVFAYLAAVYLTLEAESTEVREDFRRRAIGAWIAVAVTAAVALVLATAQAPRIAAALLREAYAVPLHLVNLVAALVALWALARRRWVLARVAAAAEVALILWGWALAQYPYLVPPDLDLAGIAAPPNVLRLVLIGVAAGMAILVPSLWYLLRIFKGRSVRENA